MKLYVGDGEAGNRKRLPEPIIQKFLKKTDTKYLWAEIKIKNLTTKDWNYEIYI